MEPQIWKDGRPGYRAVMLADSVSVLGHRMISMLWTGPRFILAEINTHRDKSRNSNSSRAMPTATIIRRHEGAWFEPEEFLENRAGMQGGVVLDDDNELLVRNLWRRHRAISVDIAKQLAGIEDVFVGIREDGTEVYRKLNVHKQYANRVLEAHMWHDMVISGTAWANMMKLRRHPKAQPQFKILADLAGEAMADSVPRLLQRGEFHRPFITREEELSGVVDGVRLDSTGLNKVAVGRCAYISYKDPSFTHDPIKDMERFEKMESEDPPHASAFEHVARCMADHKRYGNLEGWKSVRYDVPNHDVQELNYTGKVILPDGSIGEI